MNGWTRDQILMAIGIVVAIVLGLGGYVVSISQPEIRKIVWGDNSTKAVANLNKAIDVPSQNGPTPAPTNSPTVQPTPEEVATTEDNATRDRYELELYDGFGCTCPDLQEDITELQTLLNKHGFSLEVDGLFGLETEEAVIQFQGQHGLQEDGIVGSETWAVLLGN
jgi:peptidoglycan hydrolase-like protein with peptidoglycan-binding domain